MKTTELLEKNPLATELIRKWFFDEMTKSIEIAEDVPEEFKQAMLKEGVSDERLAILIDAQPRTLFDVFDENNLIIEIVLNPEDIFTCRIKKLLTIKSWKTRKESEAYAIEAAFSLLEEQLKPIDLPELKE
jgi:hypothetical protein